MNAFFAQHCCLKRSIGLLLMISLLNVTLTFAEEPAKAAAFPQITDIEKSQRIKKLQDLTLEELQQVRIVSQTKDNTASNISIVKNTTCSSKKTDNDSCK